MLSIYCFACTYTLCIVVQCSYICNVCWFLPGPVSMSPLEASGPFFLQRKNKLFSILLSFGIEWQNGQNGQNLQNGRYCDIDIDINTAIRVQSIDLCCSVSKSNLKKYGKSGKKYARQTKTFDSETRGPGNEKSDLKKR